MAGCAGSVAVERYRLPILAECKDFTTKYLSSREDLNFKYYDFDSNMDSHKKVIGLIEVWGKEITKDVFLKIHNLVSYECGTNATEVISDNINELSSSVLFHARREVDKFYIKIDGKSIVVHMRDIKDDPDIK